MKFAGWKVLVSLWVVVLISLPLLAVPFEVNEQIEREDSSDCLVSIRDKLQAQSLLDGPEVEDRVRDVKLFGLVRLVPQFALAHVDIVSAKFSEESDNRKYLYLTLELRSLKEKTILFEAVYAVDWTFDAIDYATAVHVRPDGIHAFWVGMSTDWDDDIEDWNFCEGFLDTETNTLTWIVPKGAVGNPQPAEALRYISPHTHLRFTSESGLPRGDLFKDLSHNAKLVNDYIIQY